MTITTELEINQEVYVIKHNEIKHCYVSSICIVQNGRGHSNNGQIETRYTIKSLEDNHVNEPISLSDIYLTKEEAALGWLKSQGLSISLTEQ